MLVGCHCLVLKTDVEEEMLALEQFLVSWEGWRAIDEQAGFEARSSPSKIVLLNLCSSCVVLTARRPTFL